MTRLTAALSLMLAGMLSLVMTAAAPMPQSEGTEDSTRSSPTVTIARYQSPVTEGTNATFKLTATSAPSSNLTLNVDVTESGAFIDGTAPTEITLSSGSTTAWLIIATDDDSTDESNGSVSAEVESGTGYRVGTTSSATVTVRDNDPTPVSPTITIARYRSPVTEGTNASFRLTASSAPTSNLTLNVNVTQSGSFIDGIAPSSITLSSGSTTAWLIIATDNDSTDESNGSVSAEVESGTGYRVGTTSSATVTVRDNDPTPVSPTITIARFTSPVTEGANATFRLTASSAPSSNLTLNVNVTESGSFIDGTPASSITLSSGSTTAWLIVATDDDSTDESDGSVTARIRSGAGYRVGSPSSATVTVRDEITLTIARYRSPVTEGTNASYLVTAGRAPSSTTTVNVNVTETGSFIDGTPPTRITLSSRSTTAWLIVPTDDDSTDEPNGSVRARIRSGTGYQVGSPSSATVTVRDNDTTPTITIARHSSPVTEGTNASFKLTASQAPASNLTLNVNVTDSGSFIQGTPPTSITLASGSTTAWLIIATEADSTAEANGTVTARIRSGTGYRVGTPSSASVTVRDPFTLTIARHQSPVTEGTNASFIITASRAPTSSIQVDVNVTESGSFISGTSPTEVTLASGSTTAWVIIPTVDDSTDEANGSISTRIQSGTGYSVGTPSSATVTVQDNDPIPVTPTITIARHQSPVTEGANASFKLTASQAPISNLTLNVNVTDSGSFIQGTPPTSITLASGSTTAWLIVPTVVDSTVEPNGTVTARIRSGTGYRVGTPSSAAVTVRDPFTLTIARSTSPVTEGTSASFLVSANRAPSADLQFNVNVTESGSFVTGTQPTQVTLTSGSATALVIIQTDDDSTDEPDGSVTTTLRTGTGYSVGTPSSASVTVQDNDPDAPASTTPTLTIAPSTSPVTEGANASFIITADRAPSAGIQVSVNVTQSGAFISGTPPTEVTLASGSTTAWIIIPTVDDATDEADGSVTTTLAAGAGYQLGATTSASVTVHDEPTLTVAAHTSPVNEGANASFIITADRAPAANLQVSVNVTQSGSFISGTPPTQVTLASGSTTAWVIVQTDDDDVNEAAGSVTTALRTGAGYQLGSTTSASVTVEDPGSTPNLVPSFGSEASNQSYTAGAVVSTQLPQATGGDGALSYSIDQADTNGSLGNGLSFTATTRTISGTPTTAAAAASYTYRVADSDANTTPQDSDTSSFTITVAPAPTPVPLPNPPIAPWVLRSTVDNANGAVTISWRADTNPGYQIMQWENGGWVPLPLGSYTVTCGGKEVSVCPADSTSAVLSGYETGAYNHAVRGHNGTDASTVQSSWFTARVQRPDVAPSFGAKTVSNQTYYVNQALNPAVELPEATGGNGDLSYTLTPALPAGFSFDDDALTISGTPTAATASATYTYKVTDADTNTAATDADTLSFTVTVLSVDLTPMFVSPPVQNQTFYVNRALGPVGLLAARGGNGKLTYEITPPLPAGLSFDPAARTITGTPAAEMAATTYTYTATDSDSIDPDSASHNFTIQVLKTLLEGQTVIVGGLQLHTLGCTLSFPLEVVNANPAGATPTPAFSTAGHCTRNPGTKTGATWEQGTSPSGSTGNVSLGTTFASLFPSNTTCRVYGDATPIPVANCRVGDQAYATGANPPARNDIFHPALANTANLTSPPDEYFVQHNSDVFRIVGARPPQDGEQVHKVGRTTGWTTGNVRAFTPPTKDPACPGNELGLTRKENNLNTYYIECRTIAAYEGEKGDSGSPVFVTVDETNTPGVTEVLLVGVNWGSNVNASWFVPIDRIYAESLLQGYEWTTEVLRPIPTPVQTRQREAVDLSIDGWTIIAHFSDKEFSNGLSISYSATLFRRHPVSGTVSTVMDATGNRLEEALSAISPVAMFDVSTIPSNLRSGKFFVRTKMCVEDLSSATAPDKCSSYGANSVELNVPPAPEGLRADPVSGTLSGLLTWNALTGASQYEIGYRAENEDDWQTRGPIDGTTTTIGPLGCNKTYEFIVRAQGTGTPYGSKWGFWSGATTATIGAC